MKFKVMHIKDSSSRQKTMHIESDKEIILYADQFLAENNQNHEFVIGLPLEVREWKQNKIDSLAQDIKTLFCDLVQHEQVAVAIHNKKQDDEVHFHISYNGEMAAEETVRTMYSNLV